MQGGERFKIKISQSGNPFSVKPHKVAIQSGLESCKVVRHTEFINLTRLCGYLTNWIKWIKKLQPKSLIYSYINLKSHAQYG